MKPLFPPERVAQLIQDFIERDCDRPHAPVQVVNVFVVTRAGIDDLTSEGSVPVAECGNDGDE